MAKCPDCHGEGSFSAFVDWHENGRLVGELRHGIECRTCNGSGKISDGARALYDQGRAFRDRRVAADKSLMEASRALGVRPSALSRAEHGAMSSDFIAKYEAWLASIESAA